MKHIFFWLLFLSVLINTQAQTPLLPLEQINITYGHFTDYIIPNNINKVSIKVVGARGESVILLSFGCNKFGGRGASIAASFIVGEYACASGRVILKPGGTLRFVIGKTGYNDGYVFGFVGGGGGGSAALYLAPGSSNWVILLVAGGGGGAGEFNNQVCKGFDGKDAELGESGGDGAGPNAGLGGSNGNGGFAGGLIYGDGGGGGGAFSPGQDGTRPGIGGKAGGNQGGNGGTFVVNNLKTYTGGFGFGGGGAAAIAGGGGGGYSGGGGGGIDGSDPGGGGGGGSYVIPGATDISKTLFGTIDIFETFPAFASINPVAGNPTLPVSLVSATLSPLQVVGCSTADVVKSGLPYSTSATAVTLAQFNLAGGGIVQEGCTAQTISYIDVLDASNNKIVHRSFTVTDGGGNTASGTQDITIVNPAVSASVSPESQTVCVNVAPATITLDAFSAGGITVQWYMSESPILSDATLIPGAINGSYTPQASSLVGITYYLVRVKDGCGTVAVQRANVTVVAQPVTWYKDADNDGYSDGTNITQCVKPANYKLPSELIATSGDCDDNDAAINPTIIWYKDADNDGYSDGTNITQCIRPDGYKLPSELIATSGDCDDANPDVNPKTVWVLDADGDGYYLGIPVTSCTSPGVGYYIKVNQLPGDCNDNDASVHAPVLYYVDADKDGYGSTVTAMLCSSTAPVGYSTNNTDCNDNDASVHAPVQYYIDADKDGYGSTVTAMLCSSTAPVGYSTNNTDCNDNDASVHSPVLYYVDADGDGFGSVTTAMLCSSTAPVGYSTNNTDCNDNDASVDPATVWILDYDQDGYYSRIFTQCTSPGTGFIIKSTQLPGDCNDNNASVNPGAKEVCGNGIDDNCNGFIDESICYPCLNATNLQTISITATSAQLNWTAVANAVQWQVQYKTTKQGSKWVDVFVTGNKRFVVLTGLLNNQNYQWQIRAKCGNNWTSYSNIAIFKTGTTNLLSRVAISEITHEPVANPVVRVYPNPSQGQFLVEMQLPEKDNNIVNIQVVDLTGKVLQTETTIPVQGYLKKNMILKSTLAKGMYTLRIITGNKTYNVTILQEK